MNVLLLISLTVVSIASAGNPVPNSALTELQSTGAAYLGGEITRLNTAMTDAVAAFEPINATCMSKFEAAKTACGTCVNDKCVARAKDVCEPSDFEKFLGGTINFFAGTIPDVFTDIIPDFFENTVGGAFVDLGDEIVDVTKDIGSFFENDFVGAFEDLGSEIGGVATDVADFIVGDVGGVVVDIGEGIADVATDIGDFVVDDIGGVVVDIGEGIADIATDIGDVVVDDIGGVVVDIGEGIGDFFSGLGKRSVRVKRSGEPGCSALQNDAATACKVYLDASYCADCGFSTATDCPGYDEAVADIQEASDNRAWMNKATSSAFAVLSVSIDFTKFQPDGTFADAAAKVHIFGKEFSFTVSENINPYVAASGEVIAKQALELFKAS